MAMRDLLYFNPDPEVPDSDLLGVGDFIYSDGSTDYMQDPELAAGLAPIPPGMSPGGAVGMGPPAPDSPMAQPMGPPPLQPVQFDTPELGPVELDPNTGNLAPIADPMTGQLMPQQSSAGASSLNLGGAVRAVGEALEVPPMAEFGLQQEAQPVTFQSEQGPMTIEPTGNIQPGAGGVPVEQLQQQVTGGMIPVQREGALPADVAQRQAQEMGAMHQQTLLATEQARRDESRIYGELVLKQMAANEAERVKREQDLADQQARAERLQSEFQQTNAVQLDQSVRGAMGDFSGTMGIIGAVFMGAAGNDLGWRMLDRNVDRFAQDQVRRKDTALHMLAQQYGNTQQAIAAGKAALYKVAADRLDIMAQKAKGDVYEAQSPLVIQQLREKQGAAMQEFERLSLGKTLEKAPLPPKPPTPEQMQAYGKLRRDRDAGVNIGQRVEQQLGLIWEPGQRGQPGHFRNKDDVLGKGIQGIGNLEQWVPDAVYSTMGGTTAEGYQVRGAAEAMAYATIRQMQPIGPISNADIKAAVKAGALNTEEGMVAALERIRMNAEEQQLSDAAEFSPQVVAEYERLRQASGGVPLGQAPAAARPATTEEKRNTAVQLRGGAQPQAQNAVSPDSPEERSGMLHESLTQLGQAQQIPPEGIAILMAQAGHETADFTRMPQNNYFGMKSSGRNRSGGAGAANLMTTEGEGSGAQRVRQNFATFDTPAAAATDMLSLLGRRYPRALEALQMGDVDAYVAALKDGGYFTGNEDQYRAGLLRRL